MKRFVGRWYVRYNSNYRKQLRSWLNFSGSFSQRRVNFSFSYPTATHLLFLLFAEENMLFVPWSAIILEGLKLSFVFILLIFDGDQCHFTPLFFSWLNLKIASDIHSIYFRIYIHCKAPPINEAAIDVYINRCLNCTQNRSSWMLLSSTERRLIKLWTSMIECPEHSSSVL